MFALAAKALAACNKAVWAKQKSPDPVRGMLTFCKLAPFPCWHLQQMVVEFFFEGLDPSPGSALRRHSNIHEQFTRLCSRKILQSFLKLRINFDTVRLISGCWACTVRSGLRCGSCDSSPWRNKSQPSHAEVLLVARLPLQAATGLCWREYVRTES